MEDMKQAAQIKDRLAKIVALQKELMERLGVESLTPRGNDSRVIPSDSRFIHDVIAKQTKDMVLAIHCELTEIMDGVNWKPWKKTRKDTDLEYLYLEFTDVLHFILEIMIMWGMDADMIAGYYLKKMGENHKRQDRGY